MSHPASVAFVCEGDAERDAFSGTARSMLHHLRALGHEITAIDVRPSRAARLLAAALTFSPDRARWRARFRYGALASEARTRVARAALLRLERRPDVVLQIGATFEPPLAGELPYAVYCDWNMALSARFRNVAGAAASGLSPGDLRRADERQRTIYRGAAVVFTISARLRQSFLEDYGLPPERVVVAYPGENVDPADVPPRGVRADPRPTILFVGREFERKGGDVLVEAFRTVRRRLPGARLLVIGPEVAIHDEGVEVLGLLRKSVPAERDRLLRAFAEADVFCLPARLDPFPNVVREAMFFGLPCVTSDVFALPEMVVDGETGFTVPVDDAAALARRLVDVLQDEGARARLGAAARQRAARLFTWTGCARTMHEQLEAIRRAHAPGAALAS